jgi:hypothetical protein
MIHILAASDYSLVKEHFGVGLWPSLSTADSDFRPLPASGSHIVPQVSFLSRPRIEYFHSIRVAEANTNPRADPDLVRS